MSSTATFLFVFWGAIAFVVFAVWIYVANRDARHREKLLSDRIERLERAIAAGQTVTPVLEPAAVGPVAPVPVAPVAPAPAPTAPPRPRPAMSVSQMEEWVGSVWLQNAGSVLLLVGVFFLILWGYSTGRLGPGVLVAAGVAMGFGFLWRGDRVTRTTPAFGHALLGIGVGIIYLSLYVGHVQLGVLPRTLALVFLVLVSIGSILLGLRYRVQTIAVLGVIGAFVPPLLGAWLPLAGFALVPDVLLAYLAAVGLSVYGLSARAGWSRLDLTALFLATLTWAATVQGASWSWRTEIGLALLFVLFGLAPLPALARRAEKPRVADLAVIAMAPLLFVLLSLGFAWQADRYAIAALSLALAVIYAGAALWTDSVRQERDLWKSLTASSVLFLTLGLGRLVGGGSVAMAWSLEGLLLVSFGLRAQSAWLRMCGTVVMGLATMSLALRLGESWGDATAFPFLNPHAIRDLVSVASLLVGSHVLGRERVRLTTDERWLAEGWTWLGNGTLAAWLSRECSTLALRFDPIDHVLWATTFVGVAWTVQMAAAYGRGLQGRPSLRWVAYTVAALILFEGIVSLLPMGALEPAASSQEILIAWVFVLATHMALCDRLASRRAQLGPDERRIPEVWTVGIVLFWMAWTARQANLLAAWTAADSRSESILSAALTSASWLVVATVLTVAGWVRKSAFLRWVGLALFGLTVLKILVVDLQRVDVFWRFLSAVLAGVALLAVSYAYQRKRRLEAASPRADLPGAVSDEGR